MQSVYMKSLVEVVDKGGFSQAADALCVTQSAVSRRIKFLEEQYGVPLIDRSTNPVQATPAGAMVIEKARQILALERDLLDGLARIDARHSFGFCCTPSFGSSRLPAVISEYMRKRHNAVEIRFGIDTPRQIVAALRAGAYDLAVIEHCPQLDLGEFTTAPLGGDELAFVSAAASPLAPGEVTLDELLEHTIFVRPPGCCARVLLESGLEKFDRSFADFKRVVEVNDVAIKVQSVLSGYGIAFVSQNIADMNHEALKTHYVDGFGHERLRTLVLGPRAEQCPVIGEFRESLVDALDGLQAPCTTENTPSVF
jgi:DNA-binding transcriptional LysR family regulator